MIIQRFSMGIKFVVVYVTLCIIALAIAIYPKTGNGLSWLYLMALTFPWSYIESIILMVLNISDMISETVKIGSLVFFAIINTVLIYYLGMKTARAYSEVVIDDTAKFINRPEDEEGISILMKGEKGRLIGRRYYRGSIFYRIKLQDGRKGFVKGDHGVKLQKLKGP